MFSFKVNYLVDVVIGMKLYGNVQNKKEFGEGLLFIKVTIHYLILKI